MSQTAKAYVPRRPWLEEPQSSVRPCMRPSVRASVTLKHPDVLALRTHARTDARTDGRRIEALPARAYREHRLFQLGTPSVAFAKYPWPESGRATDAPRTRHGRASQRPPGSSPASLRGGSEDLRQGGPGKMKNNRLMLEKVWNDSTLSRQPATQKRIQKGSGTGRDPIAWIPR